MFNEKKQTRGFWSFLIWLCLMSIALASTARGEDRALLIGVGRYAHLDDRLNGVSLDLDMMKETAQLIGFPKQGIKVLEHDQATTANVYNSFENWLMKGLTPEDRVLIYFSGHGSQVPDENNDEKDGFDEVLLLYDTTLSVKNERQTLSGVLHDDRFHRMLTRIKSRNILVVLDACHSGSATRSLRMAPQTPPAKDAQAKYYYYSPMLENAGGSGRFDLMETEGQSDGTARYIAITACRDDEMTVATSRGSIFTRGLLQVVRAAARSGQALTPEILQQQTTIFIRKQVKSDVAAFHPQLYGHRSLLGQPLELASLAGGNETAPQNLASFTEKNFESEYSSSHALVVGINRYHHWPGLEYAAKDARAMAVLLELQGFQIHLLTNEQATRQNILAELKIIDESVDRNSRVVFYFAGHGQTEDLPGAGERGYLVPVDADAYDWQQTMLSMNHLNQRMKRIRAKHILMAFDSCYSGLGLTRSIRRHPEQGSAYIQKMMRSRSIQILTAGSRSEQAIEAAGHGLFTDHLLAAISGAADINADGYITATEIYATVRPSITQKSHSRQTPQFGYIEGNGDIIFFSSPHESRSAAVLVDNRRSGIDVWAGNSEIGHRLPTGRHRLRTTAGNKTIIVKKGGRTLYRKIVKLLPNRTFTIQIDAEYHQAEIRDAFSVLTIANRKIENFSNSIACDLDNDRREEIVTASGKRLYAFKTDGSIVWEKEFEIPITLDLIEEWNSQPAIGLTAWDDDNVNLMLLNQRGEKIWQHVRKINRYHRGKPDGGGNIARLADIDQDGREEVIAITGARYSLKPRGLIVYDHAGNEMWRYTTGPSIQNIVIWANNHGRPDIIMGTFSPGNGNHEVSNGTSDKQSYVISINGHGNTNWILGIGEFNSGVKVMLADPAGTGVPSLYAHKYTSSLFTKDAGTVYRISKSGGILNQFTTDHSILSVTAAESTGSSQGFLYAADNNGNLFKLDDRLNLLQKKMLHKGPNAPEIRLVGVHDYDGDGFSDLLFYTFNRLLSERNPLASMPPDRKVFYSNLQFQVISQNLSKLLKSFSIAENWGKMRGFTVKDFDRPETAYYPFMALSDRIEVYNF
jgi:uncharacterized caspase-like protein